MKNRDVNVCVDAGSEYCPCYLAETENCITCPHLQGKGYCECRWTGTCIYQEFKWNGDSAKTPRTSQETKILDMDHREENLLILKLKVNQTIARHLAQPGSYVFLRHPDRNPYYDTPMSVMDVDKEAGIVTIAIQILGPKTKALLELKDIVMLRGPYWNGVLGFKELKYAKDRKILVVARGIALAPATKVINYLLRNNNDITLVMDHGKLKDLFIKDYLDINKINATQIDVISEAGNTLIKNLIKEEDYDLCFSGGSDTQHRVIYKYIDELGKDTKMVITNNAEICCGEGICGSCSIKVNGEIVKVCKSQIDPLYILEKGGK